MQYLAMRTQALGILNRSDCTDSDMKTYFQQAIADIQRDLRAPFMEEELDINTTNAVTSVPVPNDYLETITFVVTDPNGDGRELQYLDIGNWTRQNNIVKGEPVYYTRRGSNFYVTDQIDPGATAYFYYYGELTPLVNDTDEPTLALIAPDLIIYRALQYAGDFYIDDRTNDWRAKADAIQAKIDGQAQDGEDRTGTSAVQPAHLYDDEAY